MHSLFSILTLSLVALCSAGHPKKPGLTYLYTANITTGPGVDIGPGPFGSRSISPVTGGIVYGPAINGTVRPVGGDWGLTDNPNGTLYLDVRQTFETNDGAFIQVFESGCSEPDGTGHVRLTFETGSPKYFWLNTVVGVGIIYPGPTGATIEAWQLESP